MLPLCSPDQIQLDPKDLRWVGAWWLSFLITSCLLFLTSLPYLFFPKSMDKEVQYDRACLVNTLMVSVFSSFAL